MATWGRRRSHSASTLCPSFCPSFCPSRASATIQLMAFPVRRVELRTGKGLDFRPGDLGQVTSPSVKLTQSPAFQMMGGGDIEVCLKWEVLSVCE